MNQETTNTKTKYFNVAPNVWGMKDIFVNFYMIKNNEDKHWVLIDTGLKISAPKIKKMAAELFGEESRPKAIILTHGHFDHVGSLKRLKGEFALVKLKNSEDNSWLLIKHNDKFATEEDITKKR